MVSFEMSHIYKLFIIHLSLHFDSTIKQESLTKMKPEKYKNNNKKFNEPCLKYAESSSLTIFFSKYIIYVLVQ